MNGLSSGRFNPCFDGSEARAWPTRPKVLRDRVSILVLMEVKREVAKFSVAVRPTRVSILVLMEVKRERFD